MPKSDIVAQYVIKTGLLVVGRNERGVLVEMPPTTSRPKRCELVTWQEVECAV